MFIFLMIILGAAVGSFLTVAVERFERGESFAKNRSYCESCKKQLRWWELLPIVSYVAVRGKCARCQALIPMFMFWFEVITAAVFGLFAAFHATSYGDPFFYAQLVVIASLLLLFFYDMRYQVFPGLYLLISAVLTAVWVVAASLILPDMNLANHLLGAAVGLLLLGVLAVPSQGKWMGYGDVLLAGVLGLWVGYPLVFVAVISAFYLGAIMGVGLLVFRRVGQDHRIPFGPFLILGAFITEIWGNGIFHAIMNLWGG